MTSKASTTSLPGAQLARVITYLAGDLTESFMAQLFTFDTTHHALWAEEIARDAEIPVEVVPAPPAAQARCNLALQCLPEDVGRLAARLSESGVPYQLYVAAES